MTGRAPIQNHLQSFSRDRMSVRLEYSYLVPPLILLRKGRTCVQNSDPEVDNNHLWRCICIELRTFYQIMAVDVNTLYHLPFRDNI